MSLSKLEYKILACAAITVLGMAPTWAAANKNTEAALIVQLKKAAEKGDFSQYTRLNDQLPRNSIFAPYADGWLFRLVQSGGKDESGNIPTWSTQEVLSYLNRNESSWPAEEIRRDWLQQMALNGDWTLYPEQRSKLNYRADQGVECADLWYSSTLGNLPRHDIVKVLSTPKGLPKVCRSLIRRAFEAKQINDSDLNLRVFNLVGNNQASMAQRYVNELSNTAWGTSFETNRLDSAINSPESILGNENVASLPDLIIAVALIRQSMTNYEAAAERLRGPLAKHLKSETKQWLWAHLGYRAALQWDRNALSYFKRSSPTVMSPDQKEWKVRSALLLEDWVEVGKAIDEMPESMAKEDSWQYWKGRSKAASGQIEQARAIWAKMSSPFNFYGKLATEELGVSISAPEKPKFLSSAEIEEANQHPGLKRALELYNAGMRKEGFWEFNLQVAQMNDRQLLAAANWARKNELFDRAIAAADRTKLEHDLSLRYLTPFKDTLVSKAKDIGVDEAWVYGIIRQESRFVTIAKSHVGASGLMQVMPATAKYVANKIGLKNFQPDSVTQIDTNLTLGTNYLKMMHQQLDNSHVLASAGYNAGPGRPSLWRKRLGADRVIEGAIFAELIPFDETRGYVKNVMSNTVAYSLLLKNESIPLKQRLGLITGRN
jgi:soluble lytic murein transglycosylase